MTHQEALDFIKPISFQAQDVWADLGAGSGTFTQALAEHIGAEGLVHAIDKQVMRRQNQEPSKAIIKVHKQDFSQPLNLGKLNGIFMANALHFVHQQKRLLAQLKLDLKPKGQLVVLEYDIRHANPWIPFPVSFEKLERLAYKAGLPEPQKVATRPSRYHREMYLAVMQLLD